MADPDTIRQQHSEDDLARARIAFRGCTPAQMHEPYGHSGLTRQQVVDAYRRQKEEVPRG